MASSFRTCLVRFAEVVGFVFGVAGALLLPARGGLEPSALFLAFSAFINRALSIAVRLAAVANIIPSPALSFSSSSAVLFSSAAFRSLNSISSHASLFRFARRTFSAFSLATALSCASLARCSASAFSSAFAFSSASAFSSAFAFSSASAFSRASSIFLAFSSFAFFEAALRCCATLRFSANSSFIFCSPFASSASISSSVVSRGLDMMKN
jgi:hypothetical protein